MTRRVKHLGRAAQFVGAKAGKELLDGRSTHRRAQIAPRGGLAGGGDGERVGRVLKGGC